MSAQAIAAVIVILVSGLLIFKNTPINQPQPTADKGFIADFIKQTGSASPSPTPKVSNKPKASASTQASPTPQSSATQNNSGNSSNNSNSSSSNNFGNSSTSTTPAPSSASSTPTPTPAPSSCSSLCFDRSSASVEVVEGVDVQSGGSTAFAFNLTGDGFNGFLINVSGLPAGMVLNPASGGFAQNGTQAVKVWVNTNNATPYGTYNGTVTLKKGNGGGSYSEVGTMNITVTYKKP